MAADKKTAVTRAATSSQQAAAHKPRKQAAEAAPAKPAKKAAPVAAARSQVRKPEPGKSEAKKAAAKPEVKKPEVKKAAAKPEVKKPEVKKAAAKPEVKKPGVKKAAAKPEVKKPEVKKAAAKPEVKKPEVKKPEPKKERPSPPPPSPFAVGDKVVYPHHGAAVITRKERVEFQGQRTDYFVLEVATDQLILKVPVFSAVERGVRPVISRVVARKVLATFKEPPEEAGANWSRWYKLLTEKINSGDIFQVAEVVRDLTFAQQTKGISPALKRMLSKARLILASELRFALDVTEEEAMRRLDKALPRLEAAEEI
jgi:CarD family transcriptional regulator